MVLPCYVCCCVCCVILQFSSVAPWTAHNLPYWGYYASRTFGLEYVPPFSSWVLLASSILSGWPLLRAFLTSNLLSIIATFIALLMPVLMVLVLVYFVLPLWWGKLINKLESRREVGKICCIVRQWYTNPDIIFGNILRPPFLFFMFRTFSVFPWPVDYIIIGNLVDYIAKNQARHMHTSNGWEDEERFKRVLEFK